MAPASDEDLRVAEGLLQKALLHVEALRQKLPIDVPGDVVSTLDDLTTVIRTAEDRVSITDPPGPHFYPEVGTVFIDTLAGEAARPLVVEDRGLVSIDHHPCAGIVVFYDREEGLGEYPDWATDVIDGRIRVIWSPRLGIVGDGKDYAAREGLAPVDADPE